MIDKINELLRRVEEFKPKAAAEIEDFRIRVLGKKGELNALMEEFKTVAPELKRELGQQLNRLKQEATERINALREELQNAAADRPAATDDLTRPGTAERLGSRHPIALVRNEIVEVFSHLGYTVADGSVKGKYEGRMRMAVCSPKISLAKYSSDCFMSANETPSSM